MIASVKVAYVVQKELFNHLVRVFIIKYLKPYSTVHKFTLDENSSIIELVMLYWNSWKHLTVCKQMNFNKTFKNKVAYKL